MTDSILDELFHGCSLIAFLEQARAQQGWPDREETRKRAFRLYEEALAEKNRATDRLSAHSSQTRDCGGVAATQLKADPV